MTRQFIRMTTLIMTVISNSSCEAGMTIKEDVVLFSRVQGKVLFKGVPVDNAKVIRRYTYDHPNPIEDYCLTDKTGLFELPLILKKEVRVTPLVQFVVHQELYVEYDGVRHEIWLHGKMDKSKNSEYGGGFKPIICELTKEPINIKLGVGDYIYTNCVW